MRGSRIGTGSLCKLLIPEATPATRLNIEGFQANWMPVKDAKFYLVYVSDDKDFNNIIYIIKSIFPNQPIVGLSQNHTYYYRVRACQELHATYSSNTISVKL